MKTKKTIFFAHFGHFLSITVTTRTFLENLLLSLFFISVEICCGEFQSKTIEKIKKKVNYRYTYRQMNGYPDKHEFV